MQGVEFDNGDMYVDGHKAASDVRDEFVSVTEKLMDELAQCYNVLPQLDINNTIDHRPEGDEKWILENEKTVTQFCRKLAAERPLKDIRDEYKDRKSGSAGMPRPISYAVFCLKKKKQCNEREALAERGDQPDDGAHHCEGIDAGHPPYRCR